MKKLKIPSGKHHNETITKTAISINYSGNAQIFIFGDEFIQTLHPRRKSEMKEKFVDVPSDKTLRELKAKVSRRYGGPLKSFKKSWIVESAIISARGGD